MRDIIQKTRRGTIRAYVVGRDVFHVEILTRKTLRDFLAEFRITEPIDMKALREEWESEAAHQVVDEIAND